MHFHCDTIQVLENNTGHSNFSSFKNENNKIENVANEKKKEKKVEKEYKSRRAMSEIHGRATKMDADCNYRKVI